MTRKERLCCGAGELVNGLFGISKSFLKAERMIDWVTMTGDESVIGLEEFF